MKAPANRSNQTEQSRAVAHQIPPKSTTQNASLKSMKREPLELVDNRPTTLARQRMIDAIEASDRNEDSRKQKQVCGVAKKKNASPQHKPLLGIQLEPSQVQAGTSEQPIQRAVWFSNEGTNPIIERVHFDRPGSTTHSGHHTTAIIVIIQAVESAVIGKTFQQAMDNLTRLVDSLFGLEGVGEQGTPGLVDFLGRARDLKLRIANLREERPENRGAVIDHIAQAYIELRERVPFTHHPRGLGGASPSERTAIRDMRQYESAVRMGIAPPAAELAGRVLDLFDVSGLVASPGEPPAQHENRARGAIQNHLRSVPQAFPHLANTEVLSQAMGFVREAALFYANHGRFPWQPGG